MTQRDPQPANLRDQFLADQTRRFFLSQCGLGVGAAALGSLLAADGVLSSAAAATSAGSSSSAVRNPPRSGTAPMAPRPPHYAAKAQSVIHLFMAGGPSQLELFDNKPKLQELHGQPVPTSYIENKRFAFLKGTPTLLGTKRKFARHGQSGAEISECLPHLARTVDDVAIVRTLATDVFNHGPAKVFFNTGSPLFGRPAMGSWITYGLGSESQDLPGFVVLQSGPRGPRGGTSNWGCGFLPSVYQGVPLRSGGDPILNLSSPPGVARDSQRRALDALRDLNAARLAATGDPEISTRIEAYEMAYRMQASAPELADFSNETAETLALYGAEPGQASFAINCLLARRLVERGVRFVVLYHTDWDHHGNKGVDLDEGLDRVCRETDQASAALVTDLRRRGLADTTLTIWGGEFGRTPMGEPRDLVGRDHHIETGALWLAGAGIKAGQVLGETDELGYYPVADRAHVHDIQATILHLMGLDHLRLTHRFQGRNFRLTDVAGEVMGKLLA
jgi:hypothetical protein